MARRSSKRPYRAEHRPLDMGRLSSMPRTQTGPGGAEFTVRHVRSGDKPYTCPGCNRGIAPGTPHVVAWSSEPLFGPARSGGASALALGMLGTWPLVAIRRCCWRNRTYQHLAACLKMRM